MARGSARSRQSFPGTLPQCNFEWVQHPPARGQGRCRVDWYPIRAVERDRHRRQWHMRQWKSQAVAVAQASKTAADEVGVDARVEAHLLPPNIRCARSTGPATPGSEAACTSTTPRERRGGMSKTHSGATRQGTTCSRATDDSRRRNATGGVDERPVAAAAALGRLVRRGRRPLRDHRHRQRQQQAAMERQWQWRMGGVDARAREQLGAAQLTTGSGSVGSCARV